MSNTNTTFCPQVEAMLLQKQSINNNAKANLGLVCIHGLVSCLGILENALILWVVGFRLQRRTVASVWVLNLAMSDFLATLTLPLFTHYLKSSNSWELGRPLCSAQTSVFFLNMFVSAFLLAAISLDRCLLVTKPVWSQNHRSVAAAWKVCALGWLWAAINTFPYFLFRSVILRQDGGKLCYHHFAMYSSKSTLKRDCKVRQAATAISKMLLAFLLPLVVIVGSYILFCVSLRKRTKRQQSVSRLTGALIVAGTEEGASTITNTKATKTTNILYSPQASTPKISLKLTSLNSSNSNQSKNALLSKSFTKMVTSVVAAFTLCWAPYHVFCLLELAALYWPEILPQVQVGMPIAATFAFLNPVLNPILYAFSCPHFSVRIRQSLGALFEGLVEESGLIVPGKTRRAQSRGVSSRDMSLPAPASPNCPATPGQAPHSLTPSTMPSAPCFKHSCNTTEMNIKVKQGLLAD